MKLDVAINELSPGGEGVGICEVGGERRAVFVPSVVSGEVVRVEVLDPTERPLRGRVLELLSPSAARTKPACAFVDQCRACDWMHLTSDEQAEEHGRLLKRLLDHDLVVTHPAPHPLGYRSRARVHIETRRSGQVRVGMFARGSHQTASVDSCVILDPIVERARQRLAAWLGGAKGKGEAKLSLGDPRAARRRAVIELTWNGDLPPALFARLEREVESVDGELAGARVFAGEVRVPAKIGDPTPFIVGADGEPLRLAPGGFSQATEAGNRLLAERVDAAVSSLPGTTIIELYAGAGNLTVLLARRGREMTAVESDPDACAAAKANLLARGLSEKAKVLERDATAFAIPKGTAIVVLDPPREGARMVAMALAQGRRSKPRSAPAIVYVSCDPPTLARDVAILKASGYHLTTVETFEMFPQTSHVETLAVLVPSP